MTKIILKIQENRNVEYEKRRYEEKKKGLKIGSTSFRKLHKKRNPEAVKENKREQNRIANQKYRTKKREEINQRRREKRLKTQTSTSSDRLRKFEETKSG